MFIRQIINNNVVLVRDTGGKELIVVAKGIGYHGRTGAAVDLKRYPDHRLFVPDDAEHGYRKHTGADGQNRCDSFYHQHHKG